MMTRFLFRCSIFVMLIVLTLLAAECYVRSKTHNQYRYKHEYLSRHHDEVSTLILGNSLLYFGLKPDLMGDSAFNLANPAQDYKYDNILLRHYGFPNLKTVIVPTTYGTYFEGELDDGDGWKYARNYKIYMDVDEHSDLSKYNFEFASLPEFLFRFHQLLFGENEDILSCDSLGFGTKLQPRAIGLDTLGARFAEQGHRTDLDSHQVQISYLSKLIDFCRSRGMRLVLVRPPWHRSYMGHLDRRQYAEINRLTDSIVSSHRGVVFIDLANDPRFVDADFYDPIHLNTVGAEKFSKIMRDTIFYGK